MAILYSYPLSVPQRTDLIIGTRLASSDTDDLPITQNYSIGALIDMVATTTGAQTFNAVANVGAGVAGGNETVNLITFKDIYVKEAYKDSAGLSGNANQILSSTGTKTLWIDQAALGVTAVTGTAPIVSSGGNTPAISLANTAVTAGVYTNTDLTVDAQGRITAAVSGTGGYTLPAATAGALGGIKIGYTDNLKNYAVELDTDNEAFVNVPWTDTVGAVTSVDEETPGTSAGIPIVVDPTTGAVKVKSMAYDGGNNVGHVPTGGTGSLYLKGDGTWASIPTGLQFKGIWDASGGSGGSPDLTLVGNQGDGFLRITSVAGTAYPNGGTAEPSTWNLGDWAVYVGAAGSGTWTRVPATNAGVTSFVADSTNSSYLTMTPTTASTGAVELDADLSATVVSGSIDNTKFLRGDNKWAVPSYIPNTDETYDLNAGAKVSTSVPINLTSTSGTDNSLVNLKEGTNITLTRGSATEITIDAENTQNTYTGGTGITLNTFEFDVNVDATASAVPEGLSTTVNQTYKVQLDDQSENLVVNVPWQSGGTYTWLLDAQTSGTTETIDSGDTVDFKGAGGILVGHATSGTTTTTTFTGSGIPAVLTDGANPGVTSLYANTAAATVRTTIGAGTMSSFTVSADTDTAATSISQGETLTLAGGTNVTTVSDPDGTITINSTDQYTGTVEDVLLTHYGDAFVVGITDQQGPDVAIAITAKTGASANDYINGLGNVITFPTIPGGTITSVGVDTGGNAYSSTPTQAAPTSTGGVNVAITPQGDATNYINGAGDLANVSQFVPTAGGAMTGDLSVSNEITVTSPNFSNPGKVSIEGVGVPLLQLKNTDQQTGVDQVLGTLEFYGSDVSGSPAHVAGVRASITANTGFTTAGSNVTARNQGCLEFATYNGSDVSNSPLQRLKITPDGGFSFGSTSTAYGSQNQLLQSNGDAPPTWVNAPSGDNYYVTSASYSGGTLTLGRNGGLADVTATGFEQGDVTLAGTQTLTNKTLTTPVIDRISPSAGLLQIDGISSGSIDGGIKLMCSAGSHGQTLKSQPHGSSADNTLLLPDGTGTSTLTSIAMFGNGLTASTTSVTMSGSYTGTFTATGDLVAYSDEKLKSNVKTLDGSKVYAMRGVSFDKDDKKGSGVIAQELEKVAPELIHDEGEYKAVAYGNISGYLIEAIKELKAEIEELKNKPCSCNNCNCNK